MAVMDPGVGASRRARAHPRRNRSGDGQVVGALLVLGGVAWLLQQTGVVSLSVTTTLSALLIALGVGLVATARRPGGAGLVGVGLALTVVLASSSAVDASLLRRGVGERTFLPATTADLEPRYQLGVGSMTLDLSRLTADGLDGDVVRVQVGVGEIVVVLPPASTVPVEVVAEARGGEIDLLGAGSQDGGTDLRRSYRDRTPTGTRAGLRLDLDVGLGSIQVVRPRPA